MTPRPRALRDCRIDAAAISKISATIETTKQGFAAVARPDAIDSCVIVMPIEGRYAIASAAEMRFRMPPPIIGRLLSAQELAYQVLVILPMLTTPQASIRLFFSTH